MKLIDTPLLYSSTVSRTWSAITAGSSSMANVTVRSNPCGPVMSTRDPPLNGSAAIHASCEPLACLPPATTAASMRSRRAPGTPLTAKTGAAYGNIVAGLQRRPPDAGHQHLQIRLGHRVALPGFPRREVLVVRRRVGARQFNWPSALPNRQHLAVAILLRIIAFCVPPSAGRSGLSFPVFLAGFRHAD